MFLLSGHHRIMEAAEAALVMMVLEEDGSFWASYPSCQLSRECRAGKEYESKAGVEEEKRAGAPAKRLSSSVDD
jgi:hypothetical protein